MENKSYNINITQKDHLTYILHEIRFHALLVSLVAFLGFGTYSAFFVINASPKFNSIALLNILMNIVLILIAIAAANLVLYLVCNYVAALRVQREARFNFGKLTLADDAVSYSCDAADLKFKWSCVQHVSITGKQFIFYVNSGLTFFVPKSSLSPEDVNEIAAFLLTKTSPEVILTTSSPETEKEFLDKLFGQDNTEDKTDEVPENSEEESPDNQ